MASKYIKKYKNYISHKDYMKAWHKEHRKEQLEYKKTYHLENREKERIAEREYYQTHKKQWKAKLRRHYLKHRDRMLAQMKFHYQNNKEEHKIYSQIYRHNNRQKMRKLQCKNYKMRKEVGGLTKQLLQMVYEDNIKKYGTLTCYLCLKSIEFGKDTLEHKIPIIRGGNHSYNNLAIAHHNCNSKKGRKTYEEYIKEVANV